MDQRDKAIEVCKKWHALVKENAPGIDEQQVKVIDTHLTSTDTDIKLLCAKLKTNKSTTKALIPDEWKSTVTKPLSMWHLSEMAKDLLRQHKNPLPHMERVQKLVPTQLHAQRTGLISNQISKRGQVDGRSQQMKAPSQKRAQQGVSRSGQSRPCQYYDQPYNRRQRDDWPY